MPESERPVVVPEIPTADLKVVEEMQMAIAGRLSDIPRLKAEGKPIVWCSVLTPKEPLFAMDVACEWGNLFGAYASIFGMAARYCQAAEDGGLPRDVCSINRCGVGVACCDPSEREGFFESVFAIPDLAIGGNFPCTSESKAFLHVAHKYNLPYYVLDSPVNSWGANIPEEVVAYGARQVQGMIDFLVAHGHSFDMDKLREEVAFSQRLNVVVDEIDRFRQVVPLPIRAYDSVIALTAPLALAKEARTIEIFERLRDEIKERVERGYGIVEKERLRLLWLGLPPLYDFHLVNYPEKHGAVVVKQMLEFLAGFSVDPALLDPDRPLESIVLAQMHSPANPTSERHVDYFVKAVRDYRVDGVIAPVMRTCGLVPTTHRFTKEAIFRETGVPTLLLDIEGADERDYDPAAVRAQIDDFIATLLARKGS